jgi:type 1 fimbriae regulatory protein FimB/type 1 fimbriae regulatory protein FimE
MQAVRKHGRYGHRDATMILVAFRHGLRVSKLVQLQWSQEPFESATLAGATAEAWSFQFPLLLLFLRWLR